MTQSDLFTPAPDSVPSTRYRAARKKTRTELVIDYFKAHPNEWIDGMVFAEFAGIYAWRSRISDARLTGMQIENRLRPVGPIPGRFRSEYRFVPTVSAREGE